MKKIGTALTMLIVVVLCGIFLLLGITFVRGAFDAWSRDEDKDPYYETEFDQESAMEVGPSGFVLPEYTGDPYVELNDNVPEFSQLDLRRRDAFEIYSDLDRQGRCGKAYANVCTELMPEDTRSGIGSIKPSGWHTIKYPGVIEDLFLYNRCHLIGYQLTGENDNEKNLITGTRYLNVEGMLPFENKVARYIEKSGNHVLYRVTPIYEGENLLASGVHMEAYSVEDEGAGISFNVYCFNVQPGISIDYQTGDSSLAERYVDLPMEAENDTETEAPTKEFETETENGEPAEEIESENRHAQESYERMDPNNPDVMEFVLNNSSGKCHMFYCNSVNDMAEHNKQYYEGTIQEVLDMGYDLCKNCFLVK